MKKILLLIFVSILSIIAFAQCPDFRLEKEAWATISNNYRANSAFSYGMISYQSHEDNFYYDSPEDSLFYLGYGKGLWVAARGEAGNLSVSANEFAAANNHDFLPGPLDRSTGLPLDTICGVYNRVWKITQVDVFNHQINFQSGTLELGDIPVDLLEWPAKGNPYIEELSPDFDLAPFHDVSEDGIYDPLSGDYPIVLEENPDFIPYEFSFLVYNDLALHTNIFGAKGVGMEFHQTNYVVNCSEVSEAEQTVFTRIKYKYLGKETLSELKISLWEDNDLACNMNDYEGCNRDLNCTFFYNQNGETFTEECHDPDVPDNNGAVRSTVFLNHDMRSFRHYFLLGIGDTLLQGIDPSGVEEHYNYMNGLWRDGTPMTVGGNGYNPNSTDVTLFAYPDLPNDPQGWSMQTAQLPIPLDVRGLTGLIDETDVQPGAEGIIDMADHFLYDIQRKKLAVFDVWPEAIERLKAEHAAMLDGSFDCGGNLEICTEDCVWPGDANRDRGVTGKDFIITGVFAGQGISDGISRTTTSTEWFGYNADDWTQTIDNLNAKNADANGNGDINETDLGYVADNFGKTRDGYWNPQILLDQTTAADNYLSVQLETNEVDLSTAALFDRIVETDVVIASNLPSNMLTPIHGVSFDMRFDTNMVAPFIRLDDDGNNVFQYEFSFIDKATRDGNNLIGDNRIQYAFTNFNGANIEEGGRIINQNMHIKEDATTSNPDGRDTLVIKFYNVCVVNAAGKEVPMGVTYDTIVITNMIIDPTLISVVEEVVSEPIDFTVYPNPTTDHINIKIDQTTSGDIKLMDVNGQVISSAKFVQEQEFRLQTKDLKSGIYMISLKEGMGREVIKKFVKI